MSMDPFAFSYDDAQIDNIILAAPKDSLKVCDACGKPFLPTGRNAWRMRYCQRKHYMKCKVCGNAFDCSFERGIPNTCSKKCGDIYKGMQTKATMLKKYGVSNPSQVAEFKEKARVSNAEHRDETMQKIRNTMIQRYGAAIPRQVPELREKIDKTMLERYGVINPSHSEVIRKKISEINSSEEVKAKYKATSLAHYGTEYPAQNSESPNAWGNIKDKYEITMLDKYGAKSPFVIPECQEKAKQTCLEKYGYEYSSQSPEVHRKQWINRQSNIATDGTKLDSSYEVLVYEYWKSLGLTIERNIPISFEYNGKMHTTFIDFRVDGLLIEIKGKPHLEGVYDYKQSVPIDQKLKVYRDNHIILITDASMAHLFGHKDSKESNGLKHLDICPNPLIGVDISLFADNPAFPYAENRPKCFYNVSVNGCPTQYDAFYDKKLRWEIIKNRIQYVGGFIDAKEVLVGFNVTRKAKQPSVFSKALAVRLITQYCSRFVIYDLAAGWGARYDACAKLGRVYIACDYNKELVDWHIEQGRDTIVWHDGRTFTCDMPCSIFICPPYSDPGTGKCFEDYNFVGFDASVQKLSQCQWLLLAMKNAPKFADATMVCKIVDPGWEKYIVETIDNKSHLGTNHEYVIHLTHEQYDSDFNSLI